MELSNLKPAEGATHSTKRIGRGQGSGRGGTSTRGHKGAQSRSGYSSKTGYEGGQMSLTRRVPKFGFTNINRVEFKAVNLDVIEALAQKLKVTTIDEKALYEAGYISKKDLVKILGNGTLTQVLEIKAHAFSKSAEEAIKALNGTVVKI